MELQTKWMCVLICMMLSSAISQKLVIDPNGVYHYDDYQGDNGLRRKICLVKNPKLSTCAKHRYPILATMNKARNFVGDHAIFFIWPYPHMQHAPTPIVTKDSSFDLKFWMRRMVWKLTNGWIDDSSKSKYQNKVDGTEEFQDQIYDDNYDMYFDENDIERMNDKAKKGRQDFYDHDFHSFFMNGRQEKPLQNINRRSERRIPFVVPMNVSGCVPENNTYCNEDDIRIYENYLHTNRNYRNSNMNLCFLDENNIEIENLYYAMDISINTTSLTINHPLSNLEAEMITKLVADRLVQLIGQNCPANFKNAQIRVYNSTEGKDSKIQTLIHIQIEIN